MTRYNDELVNAQDSKAKFETIRLPLDDGYTSTTSASNYFQKPFRGVWVSKVSSSSVEAYIKFNRRWDTGNKIQLKYNMVINHESRVLDALITAPPQSNEWIELTFSFQDRIDIGNIEQQITGSVGLTSQAIDSVQSPTVKIGEHQFTEKYLLENDLYLIDETFELAFNNQTLNAVYISKPDTGSYAMESVVEKFTAPLTSTKILIDNQIRIKINEYINSGIDFKVEPVLIAVKDVSAPSFAGSLNFFDLHHVDVFNGPSLSTMIDSQKNGVSGFQYSFNTRIPKDEFKVINFQEGFYSKEKFPIELNHSWIFNIDNNGGFVNGSAYRLKALFKVTRV